MKHRTAMLWVLGLWLSFIASPIYAQQYIITSSGNIIDLSKTWHQTSYSKGELICVDQLLCGTTQADYVGPFKLDTTCDRGFFDMIHGGTCWTCPKGQGWIRTSKHIEKDDACWRPVGSEYTPTLTGGGCPSDTFFDPRNGGECWSCPGMYNRGVVAVTDSKACFTDAVCPSGTFHDPRNSGECWSCPSGYNRGIVPVTDDKACFTDNRCPTGFFDPINGGECWSCPPGYGRTAWHIHDSKACHKVFAGYQPRYLSWQSVSQVPKSPIPPKTIRQIPPSDPPCDSVPRRISPHFGVRHERTSLHQRYRLCTSDFSATQRLP